MKPNSLFSLNPTANTVVRCVIFWSLLLLLFFLSGPVTPMFPNQWQRFVFGVFGTLSALLLTWIFLKYEKRSFQDIGLIWQPRTIIRFFLGLAIGSAIFGMILLSLVLLTSLQIQLNPQPVGTPALIGYLAFFPLSLMEEIGFRAYPFQMLLNRFGLRITQLIVALVFALYHVVGGQSVSGSFLGPGVYACVFGLAAVWSGGIAVPFGIHLALNLLQPLTGMRGASGAVWTLSEKTGSAAGQMASPNTIGAAMQVTVLVVALALTEYYVRKNGKKPLQKQGRNFTENKHSLYPE